MTERCRLLAINLAPKSMDVAQFDWSLGGVCGGGAHVHGGSREDVRCCFVLHLYVPLQRMETRHTTDI